MYLDSGAISSPREAQVAGKACFNRLKREIIRHGKIKPLFFILGLLSFYFLESTLGPPSQTERLGSTLSPPSQTGHSGGVCMETGTPNHRTRPMKEQEDICLLYEPPSLYMDSVMKSVVGVPKDGRCSSRRCLPPHAPYKPKLRKFGDDWPPYGYTMVGIERLNNFMSAIQEVNRNGIEGAIMELGVWRGGAMIAAAAMQKEQGTDRDLYLFDAFGTLPKKAYDKAHGFLSVDLDTVRSNFEFFDVLDPNRVHFVQGLFQNSTQSWEERTDPVAVLRVDGNFYDSYQDVMYALYENVPVGGIVIFDDVMSHKPVKRFWNDFRADHGLPEELVQIDKHSAWFRKKKKIRIDRSKKHPPQDANKQ